ncbi:MAG: RraA family protein [Betaproteobacteria bacterium]|nr:RraA family protein [Betaproteobacteria bacterium]
MSNDKQTHDPFQVKKYYDPLRVADVCDALDGIGYSNLGLVSPEIRALQRGTRFWGVAFTVRCVPANRPMWILPTTPEIVDSHDIWFKKVGLGVWRFYDQLKPGHVVVTDTGGAPPVGLWGSENSLRAVQKGAVGIITDGQCRDSGELLQQGTPICSRGVARTIIPGRIEIIETQTRIGMGGVQVCPGDIVGCDDDGIVVVPQAVAAEVAGHAREVLLADMRKRAKHFAELNYPANASVDVAGVEKYYARLDAAAAGTHR